MLIFNEIFGFCHNNNFQVNQSQVKGLNQEESQGKNLEENQKENQERAKVQIQQTEIP